MSDFAYAYFNSELDKLDVPALEGIFEKVKTLLTQKKTSQSDSVIDQTEVERINAVYDKIPAEEQLSVAKSSMQTMWESVKNDSW